MQHQAPLYFAIAVISVLLVSARGATEQDQSLIDRLESTLEEDEGVFANDIDVATKSGIVTLSGVSESFLAKTRAAQLAKSVKGVKAVINKIHVDPSEKTDTEIAQHVTAALEYNDEINSQEMNVSVSGGVVTLSGVAFGWAHYNKAEREAGAVSGVTDVLNKLEVNWEAERSDEAIKDQIENRIRHASWIDQGSVDVSVAGGKVTLTGRVSTLEQRERIYSESWVTAVDEVHAEGLVVDPSFENALRVGQSPKISNEEIKEVITAALKLDPRVDYPCLRVMVANGSVTLKGVVTSLRAKDAADQVAKDTLGVTNIINKLKVRPGTKISDSKIEKNIIAAFQRHSDIEPYDITVNVRNGRVKLSGEVDSFYDKLQAQIVASAAAGVKTVRNQLKLD